jgi:Protein of unknown function (DUF1566)
VNVRAGIVALLVVWGCTVPTDRAYPPADASRDGRSTRLDASAEPLDSAQSRDTAPDARLDARVDDGHPGVGYASWPIPNDPGSGLPHPQSFALSQELAIDEVTGLVWERSGSNEPMTWADASARCAALSLEGQSDFRIPTRIEWLSVLAPQASPSVDASVFRDTAANYYWSASPRGELSFYAVYLGSAEVAVVGRDGAGSYSRCVRGGPAPASIPQLTRTADGVVDAATQLIWFSPSSSQLDAPSAAAMCTDRSGRLPSLAELASIVDESRAPAYDPNLFPELEPMHTWTSTTRFVGELQHWTVDLADGTALADTLPNDRAQVLCVRDTG